MNIIKKIIGVLLSRSGVLLSGTGVLLSSIFNNILKIISYVFGVLGIPFRCARFRVGNMK
jgi:hypothetical protein